MWFKEWCCIGARGCAYGGFGGGYGLWVFSLRVLGFVCRDWCCLVLFK